MFQVKKREKTNKKNKKKYKFHGRNHSFKSEKIFYLFFFVCLYNFPSPYSVGRFRGIKNTSHLFEKVIYLQLAFFIFGSDWILAL